jgi:hypothetical protein
MFIFISCYASDIGYFSAFLSVIFAIIIKGGFQKIFTTFNFCMRNSFIFPLLILIVNFIIFTAAWFIRKVN